MGAFTLDTSGAVDHVMTEGCVETGLTFEWSDLSPFAQGYVEALLRELSQREAPEARCYVGFSDLAPETLAAILKDCELFRRGNPGSERSNYLGAEFWRDRQAQHFERVKPFPPIAPYLDDEGKVRLYAVGPFDPLAVKPCSRCGGEHAWGLCPHGPPTPSNPPPHKMQG